MTADRMKLASIMFVCLLVCVLGLVTLAVNGLPTAAAAVGASLVQDWCAVEVYAGVNTPGTKGEWERFVRSGVATSSDRATVCSPNSSLVFDDSWRWPMFGNPYLPAWMNANPSQYWLYRNGSLPYDFIVASQQNAQTYKDPRSYIGSLAAANPLEGADQVGSGDKENSGFVTAWLVSGDAAK